MRILQLAHNHPAFHAGGTEIVAMALHREALKCGYDSYFLGAADASQRSANPGTNILAMDSEGRENVIWFPIFQRFELKQVDTFGGLREFRSFLQIIAPDIVHIHHFLNFGLEAFLIIRDVLPDARIVLTLHDYYSICPSNGQLFKYDSATRCFGPSLIECQKCFPATDPIAFELRKLALSGALSVCDYVTAPSKFLKRIVEPHLGLSQSINVIENGYMGEVKSADRPDNHSDVLRFGFFGNISEVKGIRDLLKAVDILIRDEVSGFHLDVYGQQLFEDKLVEKAITKAKRKHAAFVTFHGAYVADDTASRMTASDVIVFPSIWWENAPLVVYEALHANRPVLCYPHSAAVEILSENKSCHVAAESNPTALAASMKSIIHNPNSANPGSVVSVRTAQDVLADYLILYRQAA